MAGRAERSFFDIMKDALVALGVNVAFREFMKKNATSVPEEIGKKVTEQTRDDLLEEFRLLLPSQKDNLLRRHKRAVEDLREQRFVALLCKIQKDHRRETLIWLNGLDDEEFESMLYLLEDNAAMAWIQGFRSGVGRMTRRDIETFKQGFVTIFGKGAAILKDLDERAAPPVRRLTDWLEKSHENVKDHLSFRTEFFDDIKGQRTGFKTRYDEHLIGWGHWVGSTVLFRPELRFDHAYDAHPYDNGTRKSQFMFACDAIFFF